MPRTKRTSGESNVYHVVARGSGHQIIFEDDSDRERFVGLLSDELDNGIALLAWCLMSNHFHLLVQGEIEIVSACMKRLESTYARYYNWKHDRIGHLFQGRFTSEPVDDESYLLTVVRYIHANPEKGGICSQESYRWSSYKEYMSGGGLVDTSLVLSILGGREGFSDFHRRGVSRTPNIADFGSVRTLHDSRAWELAEETVGAYALRNMASLAKEERNAAIGELLKRGFSIRQIARMSGIGRGIIQRIRVGMVGCER